jgi:hypothetical protein
MKSKQNKWGLWLERQNKSENSRLY